MQQSDLLKIASYLKRVVTLPGEILMPSFKCRCSRGNIVTRFRCGGIFDDRFVANLLLTLPVFENWLILEEVVKFAGLLFGAV